MGVISNIIYNFLMILKRLLLLCPKSFIIVFCSNITRIIGYSCKKERSISLKQLEFALKDKSLLTESFLDKNFSHLGTAIAEVLFLKDLLKKNNAGEYSYVSSSNDRTIRSLVDEGKSALALSGHIGCFELLAAYYIEFGVNVSVVARKPNYNLLDRFVADLRKSYGVHTIWREDPDSMKKLLKAFREAGVIAALIDQDTALESEYAPFFGLEAASPSGLIQYAVKKNITILSSFIVRTSRFSHQIFTEEIPYQKEDPAAVRNVLTIFNQHLEKLIKQYPEQWIWWHRRWRRRPGIDYNKNPELLPSTKTYLNWLEKQ